MKATLYLPQQPPLTVSTQGLRMPDSVTGFAWIPDVVPALLGCVSGLVDILASSPSYVAYSIFDCEDEINLAGMEAIAGISGVSFDVDNEDEILCGAVLLVRE